MPATARKEVFVKDEIGIYHTMSRVVARRFLMGVDKITGVDFSHRKAWVGLRIQQLGQVFMVESLGFSILDNHFHHNVRVRPDLVEKLTDREVVRRSLMIAPGYMSDSVELEEPDEEAVLEKLDDDAYVERARERLSDISWYMKCLKEPLSRRANVEERIGGCFWEGRFKMSRLLDERAVLLCSAYIDLNEVRAGIAKTPEASFYSSVGHRIQKLMSSGSIDPENSGDVPFGNRKDRGTVPEPSPDWLSPIDVKSPNGTVSGTMTEECPNAKQRRPSNSGFLDCTLEQYLNLCDTLGRMFRGSKKARIDGNLPPIAERLLREADTLMSTLKNFSKQFPRVCGRPESMEEEARRRGLKSIRGISTARKLLGST